jgi:hypothetical protein
MRTIGGTRGLTRHGAEARTRHIMRTTIPIRLVQKLIKWKTNQSTSIIHRNSQSAAKVSPNSIMPIHTKALAALGTAFLGSCVLASGGLDVDAATHSYTHLRRGKDGIVRSTQQQHSNGRKLQANKCQVTLTEMCVSGGYDGDDLGAERMEGDLEIYHADSNGVGHWEDFTKSFVDWVFIPLDGCIDINKKVSPLGDEGSIRIQVIEHDLFSENDTYESDFSGVCKSVNEGNGEFQFTSDGGTLFTFKFEVARYSAGEVKRLLLAEWPYALGLYALQLTGDKVYAPLSDSAAREMWSNNTGLSEIRWTPSVFDCDDFSYVYKAAASLAGYEAGNEVAYAVGVIWGDSSAGGHAVNVYINELGKVKVLEPQNGMVIDGASWDYIPYFVIM